jgi:hypothetical protein
MHQDLAAVMLLELGVIVREVVKHPQVVIPWVEPRRRESLPRGVGDVLAVGECEVGRRSHSTKISFSFRTPYGGSGELPVLQLYAVPLGSVHAALDVVLADLVPEAPRSGVDQDGNLPLCEPVGPGRLLIVDFVDVLYFEEVVA